MNRILILSVCLLLGLTVSAYGQSKPAHAANGSAASVLEAKIQKAWEDYKQRDKKAFAAILAEDFAEVTNDAPGIFGKDTEFEEMDHFNLSHFVLTDFKFRPVGDSGAVMTYIAEYSGSYENAPLQMKAAYGEVWVKTASDWKLLWVQETKLK